MPPPKYNPIEAARAEFYGEPPPAYFFPPVPVAKGNTAFGGYVSPAFAAQTALEMSDFYEKDDDRRTKLELNLGQRQAAASRSRILPFSEAATIAEQKRAAAKAAL